LCIVLADRPGQIRALQLDELTHRILLEWLDRRRSRWPHTANPHLLVSKESAPHRSPVSATWTFELRGSGKTGREIAAELVIARRTVDTHVEHILTKLGFTSRTQIATLLAQSRKKP
jgi:ATP/maltotriose-dependent transcriptional regulator MalT